MALALFGCEPGRSVEPKLQAEPALLAITSSADAPPSAAQAVVASATSIDLTWQDNSTREDGFEIHRSTSGPVGAFALRMVTAPSSDTYRDGDLQPAVAYCYRVRSFRTSRLGTSYSECSSTACATIPLAAPATGASWRRRTGACPTTPASGSVIAQPTHRVSH